MTTRHGLRAALAAGFMLLAGTAGAQESVSLRLASFANADDTFGRAQQKFAEELSARSDGRISVEIFNNNTLGSNREALELAKSGGVDFVVTGVAHATRYAPALNSVLLPYLWKDRETMFQVLDGEVGDDLDKALESEKLSIAGWWDNGFRHISNNDRPIVKPEDVKGLKLRTLPSSVHVAFFRELGAIPTPMDFSELLAALRQGVIDGQENPPAVVYPYGIYEVQKYYSLTGHVNEPMLLVMSDTTLDRIPEDIRGAVGEAAEAATAFQRQINDERTGELMTKLREEMEVNEVPEETLQAFRTAAQSVYEGAYEEMGEAGRAVVEKITQQSR